MGLDGLSRSCAAFDNIRIQRALGQISKIVKLGGLLFEHTDELIADDLPLLLRVIHTCQIAQEPLPGVNLHNLHIELADEGFHNALCLTLAEQTMVDEHTGQLVADGLVKQNGYNGGVHTAGERTQHLLLANLLADAFDRIFNEGFHAPVAMAAANII
ncbi:hypothetical protein D3C75_1003330 [compost metagenome]